MKDEKWPVEHWKQEWEQNDGAPTWDDLPPSGWDSLPPPMAVIITTEHDAIKPSRLRRFWEDMIWRLRGGL